MDISAYAKELAQKAKGVSDEERAAFLKVLGEADVQKDLSDRVLAKDEFSRKMDELTKQKTEVSDYYKTLVATEQHNQKVIAAYKENYGELEEGKKPVISSPADSVTRKDFDEVINKIGSQSIAVTKTAMWASADFMKKFNEVLDPDALEKHALDKGLPLKAAYEDFIKDKVEAQKNASFEERIKKEREEAVKDYATKHKMPVDSKSSEPSPFLANVAKQLEGKGVNLGLQEKFTQAWNEAGAAK